MGWKILVHNLFFPLLHFPYSFENKELKTHPSFSEVPAEIPAL